jgi:hypothetical protein
MTTAAEFVRKLGSRKPKPSLGIRHEGTRTGRASSSAFNHANVPKGGAPQVTDESIIAARTVQAIVRGLGHGEIDVDDMLVTIRYLHRCNEDQALFIRSYQEKSKVETFAEKVKRRGRHALSSRS